MRELTKPGSKAHQKDIVECVTILECPKMVGIGAVGYQRTPNGLRAVTTIWADQIDDEARRRFYKNWYKSKKKAFKKHMERAKDGSAERDARKARIVGQCEVVRLIAHSKMRDLNKRQRKAHVMEIQINGGTIAEKLAFCEAKFEKTICVKDVFAKNDVIDTIAVTKGRGTEGVTTRWGVTRLPRKTHRGLRKVACIGAWHPARVSYSVARVGQNGYHHRTEANKKIFHIGAEATIQCSSGDLTEKSINPMGGWPHYGNIQDKYVMLKGSCPGCKKRPVTLRKSLRALYKPRHLETVNLKFVDTSSKIGHGRFQTMDDKHK